MGAAQRLKINWLFPQAAHLYVSSSHFAPLSHKKGQCASTVKHIIHKPTRPTHKLTGAFDKDADDAQSRKKEAAKPTLRVFSLRE